MDEKYLMESQFSLDSLAIDDERQGEQPEQPSASEQRSELTSTGSVTTSESRSHLDSEDSQLMDSLLNDLSAWEKWFVQKSVQDEKRQIHVQKKKEERARKMEEKKMAQYQLKQKADIHFLLWKDAKEMEIREERKKRLEGERRQDEKKAAEKANIASKAEESYSHWLEMKRMKEEKTVRKAQEAKLDNEERVFQRKIENERSFNDWVAEKRHQYSNPLPVFRNPEAWQVCIPKEKKRVKVKRVEKVHLPASPPNLFKGRKTSKATIGWS